MEQWEVVISFSCHPSFSINSYLWLSTLFLPSACGYLACYHKLSPIIQSLTLHMLFRDKSKRRLSNAQRKELRRSVTGLIDLTNNQTDQNDESLNRWKASLGISNSPILPVDPNDTRRCVIHSLALETPGRPDIVIDLSVPGALESLRSKPFAIKEGAKFRMKATFKVQHEVLSGLKFLQVVKRKGVRVSKDEEMLGSYAPNTQDKPIYEKKCQSPLLPRNITHRLLY